MTIEKLDASTPDLTQQNILALLELFPECRTEGAREDAPSVDFDLLRQALSDYLVEGPAERYRLDWPGKRQALLTANTPIDKTLRPMREESVDFDTTRNLFIEGDNLDALKLLQETYLGKVKMIYIDPPYNTGKDFIYKDNYTKSRDDYEEESGQRDEEVGRLVANPESSGRYHSDWLSMLYPRLKLARNLLRDDGLIFISIDDDEVANLKKLCEEVYGEKNFVAIFSWQKTSTPPNLGSKIKRSYEYVVCFQKLECGPLVGLSKSSKSTNGLMNQNNPVGILEFPPITTETKLRNGLYAAGKYGTKSYDIELLQDTRVEGGLFVGPVILKGKFKWSQPYLNQSIEAGTRITIQTIAFSPSYEKSEYEPEKPWNVINKNFGVGTNENASDELDDLFHRNFSENLYPKPVSLIKYLASTNLKKEDIFLDFFAGSATSAHAIIEMNALDEGRRTFFAVQLPEQPGGQSTAASVGYESIAEISKERIRRAGAKIAEANPQLEGKLDTGFRAFRIDSGNYIDTSVTPKRATQEALAGMVSHIKDDRSEEDLLFGALLRWGVDITLPIEQRELAGRTVWLVDAPDDESGKGAALTACFAKPGSTGKGGVDTELADAIAKLAPLRVLFRDDGFADDATKENVHSRFKQLAPDTQVRVL